ncbi:hypothetical protein VP01_2077g3 [Puccinia sorghi]|uniref:Uncharacterized protein n=1 Tax=Puccinia sorghi TaxID=27349 RepID=A0A0L6VC99_9BASI|nr:hypothetical protein VP01_2077g3 [Puccinia sorghi]
MGIAQVIADLSDTLTCSIMALSATPTRRKVAITRPKMKATCKHCLVRCKGAPLYLARQCVCVAFTLANQEIKINKSVTSKKEKNVDIVERKTLNRFHSFNKNSLLPLFDVATQKIPSKNSNPPSQTPTLPAPPPSILSAVEVKDCWVTVSSYCNTAPASTSHLNPPRCAKPELLMAGLPDPVSPLQHSPPNKSSENNFLCLLWSASVLSGQCLQQQLLLRPAAAASPMKTPHCYPHYPHFLLFGFTAENPYKKGAYSSLNLIKTTLFYPFANCDPERDYGCSSLNRWIDTNLPPKIHTSASPPHPCQFPLPHQTQTPHQFNHPCIFLTPQAPSCANSSLATQPAQFTPTVPSKVTLVRPPPMPAQAPKTKPPIFCLLILLPLTKSKDNIICSPYPKP